MQEAKIFIRQLCNRLQTNSYIKVIADDCDFNLSALLCSFACVRFDKCDCNSLHAVKVCDDVQLFSSSRSLLVSTTCCAFICGCCWYGYGQKAKMAKLWLKWFMRHFRTMWKRGYVQKASK